VDPRRRARIFAFPQQVAAIRGALADLVGDIFTGTRFDRRALLRGVYLTSGTQEGTPIDRLLVSIGRRFAIAPDAIAGPPLRTKAFFIERLLKDVVVAESALVGVNPRAASRESMLRATSHMAMMVVGILAVAALSVSYRQNRQYLEEVRRALENVRTQSDVNAVIDMANRYRERRPPWSMRWGLFQGDQLGQALRDGLGPK
jgi:type VI secretion system protein ImpL